MRRVAVRLANALRTVWLKLESHNPGGSIKDRTAHALVESLEKSHRLVPGALIVESTSGNLGVALAYICRARGYQFVAVVDPKASSHHVEVMRLFGCEVELVREQDRHGSYLFARLQRIQQLLRERPGAVWTNQYENPANPRAHYEQTGPEILRQCGRPPQAVFVGVSTGGTIAGITRYFGTVAPATRVVGVDVMGSRALGQPGSRYLLNGIGSARRSSFVRPETLTDTVLVSDADAVGACLHLREQTGIWVGGSSGAVLAASLRYLTGHQELTDVVCICPDGGERYLDTVYSPAWLERNRVDPGSIRLPALELVA